MGDQFAHTASTKTMISPRFFGAHRHNRNSNKLSSTPIASATASMPYLKLASMLSRSRRRLSGGRSEEHTSELQSLMRISYAVFCLKKKLPHSPDPLAKQ